MRKFAGIALWGALACGAALAAPKTLDVYFIDVEGGQATLIVTPSRQSMLVDAGWPGQNNRDAERIAKAAKAAGIKSIDYLVVTHYHTDHVGGVPQLAAKLPVKNYVDHGKNNETGKNPDQLFADYSEAFANAKRINVAAGDSIPLKGVEVKVLTADGAVVNGGGQANPLCSAGVETKYPEDKSENARSVGVLISFGKFRMLDLGDLTARKEVELACPQNKVGPVDLYLTTHHGVDQSNAQELVHAIRPRVAIMNNGAKKGGVPAAWKIVRSAPGIEDLWQLHYSLAGKTEANSPDTFIANLEERCEGAYLKVSAQADGSFNVWNSRNKFNKTYAAR